MCPVSFFGVSHSAENAGITPCLGKFMYPVFFFFFMMAIVGLVGLHFAFQVDGRAVVIDLVMLSSEGPFSRANNVPSQVL